MALLPKRNRRGLSISRMSAHLAIPVSVMVLGTVYLVNVSIGVHLEQSNPIQQAVMAPQHHPWSRTTNNPPEPPSPPQASLGSRLLRTHEEPEKLLSDVADIVSSSKDPGIDAANALESAYPRETPIANPPLPDGSTTFAGCLLVMDDNHRLVEWLAYHFHVLPLRYLIVVSDPRSRTSPTYLFNRWRRQGMYIEEWTDPDFWRLRAPNGTIADKFELKPIPETADFQTKRDRHRGRQKYFYRSCLLALKRVNRTWVALHDSDEFLVYNHAGGDSFEAWEREQEEKHAASPRAAETRVRPAHTPPTTAQAGGMIRYIEQERAAGLEHYQSPCIGVPRLTFGAQESTVSEQRHLTPDGFWTDPNAAVLLDTLGWRKHAARDDFVKNALGKVIMDASRIDVAKYPFFESLHRPIKKLCSAPWHYDWNSGLRINHYLGSWDSYSFRTRDARKGGERSLEQWEYKATTNGEETDDNIRPWLSGFVQAQGMGKAQALLDGAGVLPKGHVPQEKEWRLRPETLDKILSTKTTVANDNKIVQFDAWVREKYGRK